jgi:hypothetical protein
MVYLSSGSRFGSNSVASLAAGTSWSATTAPLLDHTLNATVPAWSVSTNRTLAKGTHLLELQATNLTNGEVCTLAVSNKV